MLGCQSAAQIAEAFVADPGNSARLEIFSQEGQKDRRRAFIVRRAFGAHREHSLGGGSANPKSLLALLTF
jgi:hypothetical protein